MATKRKGKGMLPAGWLVPALVVALLVAVCAGPGMALVAAAVAVVGGAKAIRDADDDDDAASDNDDGA